MYYFRSFRMVKQVAGKKFTALFVLSIVILLPLFVILHFAVNALDVPFHDVKGFDVDSSERVYLGYRDEIYVYQNDEELARVTPKNGYRTFDVTENDEIMVIDRDTTYYLDLNGNAVEKEPAEEEADALSALEKKLPERSEIESPDGTKYRLNRWGRIAVTREDGEIVYQVSVWKAILRISYDVVGVSVMICLATTAVWVLRLALKITEEDMKKAWDADMERKRSKGVW